MHPSSAVFLSVFFGRKMRVHLPRPEGLCSRVHRGSRRHRVLQRAGRQGSGGRLQTRHVREHQAKLRLQVSPSHGKQPSAPQRPTALLILKREAACPILRILYMSQQSFGKLVMQRRFLMRRLPPLACGTHTVVCHCPLGPGVVCDTIHPVAHFSAWRRFRRNGRIAFCKGFAVARLQDCLLAAGAFLFKKCAFDSRFRYRVTKIWKQDHRKRSWVSFFLWRLVCGTTRLTASPGPRFFLQLWLYLMATCVS